MAFEFDDDIVECVPDDSERRPADVAKSFNFRDSPLDELWGLIEWWAIIIGDSPDGIDDDMPAVGINLFGNGKKEEEKTNKQKKCE